MGGIAGHALLGGTYCLLTCLNNTGLLDSGASDHICSNLEYFIDYTPIKDPHKHIIIPDGRQIHVLNIGSIQLTNDILLKNVLHIPDFQFNLLTIHKLCTDMHCKITFTHNGCFLQGQTGPSMLLGRLQGGLYNVVDVSAQSVKSIPSSVACLSTIDKAKLWHLRLGHLPFSQINHLLPDCHVKACSLDIVCQVCPAAKQSRKPFPTSSIKTTKPFELLHVDVWGPYKTKTYSGCTQFMTIVDDFTRFTWVHFMKYKSDSIFFFGS